MRDVREFLTRHIRPKPRRSPHLEIIIVQGGIDQGYYTSFTMTERMKPGSSKVIVAILWLFRRQCRRAVSPAMVNESSLVPHLLQRPQCFLPCALCPVELSPRCSCHHPPLERFLDISMNAIVQRWIVGNWRSLCLAKGNMSTSQVAVHAAISRAT